MRLLRASPSWGVHVCPGGISTAFRSSLSQCLASLAEELFFFWSYLVGVFHLAAIFIKKSVSLSSLLLPSSQWNAAVKSPGWSPFPAWTNTDPPASPASSAQSPNVWEVLPGLSPVWQGLSHAGGPKLITDLQMQMWGLTRGEVAFHWGLVIGLFRTAHSMCVACIAGRCTADLHPRHRLSRSPPLILSQCQQPTSWRLGVFMYLQLGVKCWWVLKMAQEAQSTVRRRDCGSEYWQQRAPLSAALTQEWDSTYFLVHHTFA